MSVDWIEHKGKRILRADYRGCHTEEEMLQVLDEQGKQLRLRPVKTLLLSDFGGTAVGSAFMNEVKRRGAESGDRLIEKNAVLGVTGLKGILLDGFVAATGLKDRIRSFDNEADAMAWLVE